MILRDRPITYKKDGDKRNGRGFSSKELEKTGLTLRQALRVRLPVDARRRTVHDENVKLLKQRLTKMVPEIKKKAS